MSEDIAKPSTKELADREAIEMARSLTASALPFAGVLIGRFNKMIEGLRRGEDSDALAGLGDSAKDLEQFLTFIVLVAEILENTSPGTFQQLTTFRERLLGAIEGLHPALADLDLVEVADTLEQDVVQSLSSYQEEIHSDLTAALLAA